MDYKDVIDEITILLGAFEACEVGKHPECGAVEELTVRCQRVLERSRKEFEYLRSLAGAVSAGAGDYRTIVKIGGERDPSLRRHIGSLWLR